MLQIMIEENFAGVIISLFLILFIATSSSFEKKVNTLFLKAAGYVLALIFIEALDAICALDTKPSLLRVIISAIGYSLRPAILCSFLKILCRNSNKKILLFFDSLLIINALVAFSAIFSDIAFSYDKYNEFVRGPLGFTPFAVCGIYLIILLVLTTKKSFGSSSKEYLLSLATTVICVIGAIMESIFKYNSILTSCFSISITFYYLYFHTSMNNYDPLTGALVRRRFYLDATNFSDTLTAIISLDLNDLKLFNDKYGHSAGDLALVTMTKTIKRILPKRCFLYRTGGDEFMILCNKLSSDSVMQLIADIKSEMAKTPYSCAVGYAFYNKYVGIDRLCLLADETMYKDKIAMKGPEATAKYSTTTFRQKER